MDELRGIAMTDSRAESSPQPRSWLARLGGALRLDVTVFDEVERDPRALGQATLVVAAAGLARGLAGFGESGALGLVAGAAAGLLIWVVTAVVVWAIGVRTFDYTSDFAALLRTLGFASAPLIWLALGVLPLGPFDTAVWVVAHGLAIIAFVLAVRQTLDVDTTRALVVCALAIAVSLLLLLALGLLFVGRTAS